MTKPLKLNPDRLFPADSKERDIARNLYKSVADLPIISPHGHTDPSWFADDEAFPNPAQLLITPDHYVFRMLYSQGIALSKLGVPTIDGSPTETDGRTIWRLLAENYHLFRGTPSRTWLDWVFAEVFKLDVMLDTETSDLYYDVMAEKLNSPEFRPRALYKKFNIELLSTTEGALDDLRHHKKISESGWDGRVITTYRPDSVIDPEFEGFLDNVEAFGKLTNEDTTDWAGYLNAHRSRREYFRNVGGATASDHGFETATTANLSPQDAEALFNRVIKGNCSAQDAELFRGQMLTEMARMSLDDGMTMQIHAGSCRNHNQSVFQQFGRDKGADIPVQTEYTRALKPLLDAVGNEPSLTVILFTLDEDNYSRELATMAGHYPALKLGPPWWFHDSPEGMRRFREKTTETAGFYNTVGFNDDTRAFLSIPARHDVARRMDCGWLAKLVADHRLDETEAAEIAKDLTYNLPKKAYKL
ncbi:glucuronate isomerase [Hirschia baltica]|uniref:Uronate isomerase n=1 Tax=Hirschia baltica (strain ATCC 49814 / DSM 5838 / IFAM 1418) TaxID=582402 RepID=C6XQE0_HIRBI|nr:glucuronate isomerase [Hirschia baltica]ACT60439.1 Glucuronate isomerase [Hirschia baltica ATCC 49814]